MNQRERQEKRVTRTARSLLPLPRVAWDSQRMQEKRPGNLLPARTAPRTAHRAPQLVALVFALGGCGSKAEEKPDERDPAIQHFATFVDLYADMVCGLVERCCNEANQALYTLGGDETCKDAVELSIGVQEAGTLGSLGAHSATYREDRQRACADALAAATCEDLEAGTPAECEEPWFDGTVPLGGSCDASSECIDSYCLRSASARRAQKELIHLLLPPYPVSEVPQGRCMELLGAGADCTGDSECDSASCEDAVCEETPTTLDAMCPI
jgi:hypothetical protein